ncbi:unnamed protein product [Bursaphelenchus xylophilus]|uniref:(pine wood nematode) hypothetical protein n=1 Tax=Bursaphelenchus xylophilus TaxID=6326 RepID=A0A1I7RUI8_BURXY|nr:unnamed protein product [Bursaphelenchus xylophilus]CAG9114156.1 unnamed protein product [Bursaphelenchus xylophilus]
MIRSFLGARGRVIDVVRFSTIQRFQCWNCSEHHDHHKLFCHKCNVIQPLHPKIDFFSYFGLKRRFKVDDKELKDYFRKLQSHVHPDKFGTASDKEKQISEQHSSYLNQAYKTLSSPRERAKYLLKLLTEENSDDTTTPDFAAEMFEFIEEIEAEEDEKKLRKHSDHVDSEIEQLLIQIENAFDKNEPLTARALLTRLRYFDRAKNILVNKLGVE